MLLRAADKSHSSSTRDEGGSCDDVTGQEQQEGRCRSATQVGMSTKAVFPAFTALKPSAADSDSPLKSAPVCKGAQSLHCLHSRWPPETPLKGRSGCDSTAAAAAGNPTSQSWGTAAAALSLSVAAAGCAAAGCRTLRLQLP